MHAVMGDSQMNILTNVFRRKDLRVGTYSVSGQVTVNWEEVASPITNTVWELSDSFLNNIEEYKYNKFINIGENLVLMK